jgi:hypothetical protein
MLVLAVFGLAVFGLAACGSVPSTTEPSNASPTTITTPPSNTALPDTTTARLAESTVAPTTVAPPPATAIAAATSELSVWLTQHLEAGLTMTHVGRGDSTTARLIIAAGVESPLDYDAAVLLDDQHVVSFPFDATPTPGLDIRLFGLGDRVAVFRRAGGSAALWLLDPIARTWSPGPDLGLGTIPNNTFARADSVNGSLLISVVVWFDPGDGVSVPTEQRGVLVSSDLVVTPIAQPPPRIPMSWTTVSGTHALLMGKDIGNGVDEPLREPWAYDTETDTWTAVPQPEWLRCPDEFGCTWDAPHEYADDILEAATPRGVVKLIPDGTVGLFDLDTWTWRQLDTTPFRPSSTQPVVLNDDLVAVFPGRGYGVPTEFGPVGVPDKFGTVGVLDLRTGTWTTTVLDIADAADTSYFWDIRIGDDVVLVGILDKAQEGERQPRFALDRTTGQWRTPTDTDAQLWEQLFAGTNTTHDRFTSHTATG